MAIADLSINTQLTTVNLNTTTDRESLARSTRRTIGLHPLSSPVSSEGLTTPTTHQRRYSNSTSNSDQATSPIRVFSQSTGLVKLALADRYEDDSVEIDQDQDEMTDSLASLDFEPYYKKRSNQYPKLDSLVSSTHPVPTASTVAPTTTPTTMSTASYLEKMAAGQRRALELREELALVEREIKLLEQDWMRANNIPIPREKEPERSESSVDHQTTTSTPIIEEFTIKNSQERLTTTFENIGTSLKNNQTLRALSDKFNLKPLEEEILTGPSQTPQPSTGLDRKMTLKKRASLMFNAASNTINNLNPQIINNNHPNSTNLNNTKSRSDSVGSMASVGSIGSIGSTLFNLPSEEEIKRQLYSPELDSIWTRSRQAINQLNGQVKTFYEDLQETFEDGLVNGNGNKGGNKPYLRRDQSTTKTQEYDEVDL